KKSKTKCVIF
nr:Chain C, Fusion protein [synthetic construct]1TNB_M Chain M, Fusion protein [synthetic construct]1TNB_N Chain N, Fusion protein [synthetic construct]1TNB_O Chain O, Fusion protein [synthetic construct]1TNB_P Chain P, Fusion protein [synthetic construct]1TNB_Q Chain Q, Fusion protein [synthetic construct]1TNB_R Chain R, Fusion protein [synthetic construct]